VSVTNLEIMCKDGAYTNCTDGYSFKDNINPIGTATAPVITHIQHQYTRLNLSNLRFCSICTGIIMHSPAFSSILAIHDTCIRHTGGVYELRGKNQSTILHRYSPSGTLQQKIPGRIFHLLCYIYRL
jgi:hypothetical protein